MTVKKIRKSPVKTGTTPAQAAVLADRLNRSPNAVEGVHVLTVWQWKQALTASA